jgi:hypothetical protein
MVQTRSRPGPTVMVSMLPLSRLTSLLIDWIACKSAVLTVILSVPLTASKASTAPVELVRRPLSFATLSLSKTVR